MRTVFQFLTIMLLLLTSAITSCSENKEQAILTCAESLIETSPDSAMSLLSSIDRQKLSGDRQKALYALLMSMALDKNYIDTTSFDVLQPAIDYYLEKGSPNDKLRTYYYQGVIFQNQGDRNNALNSYIKGLDIAHDCTDSLTTARTLVATGCLYNELFDLDNYIFYSLKAANIYNRLSLQNQKLDCLFKALNGAIIIGNQSLGDSIMANIKCSTSIDSIFIKYLNRLQLSYAVKFGTNDDIKDLIIEQEANLSSQNDVLNLALAYTKIGNNSKALQLLDFVENSGQPYDTIRHLSIFVPTYEGLGNYKYALSLYKLFSHKQDSIDLLKFEQASRTIEEKHRIELQAQKDIKHKMLIIWGCIGSIAILSFGTIIMFLIARSNKTKKELALEKVRFNEVENAKLKSEKCTLVLENKNLQLERDKKALEAENLAHRVEALENESDSLKSLISDKEELPIEVQREIKVRIEMLNSLLASYITNNDQYEKPYDIWVRDHTDNKEEFMNSTRLAFQVSHPRFIQYFEDHGLTDDEINYVCLYAIGLRGKEVGNYLKKRSHVNLSSAIRKKLGIDKHETNIGIYVRKLLNSL